MELSQKLLQLGFSKNLSAIYCALIEIGQCKASDIIKKTGLHRNIVYEALDDLVLKKLAFKTSKGGVAFFQLSDADSLVHQAQTQLALAKTVEQEINHKRSKSQYEVKLYEGVEGLASHREKVLEDLAQTTADSNEFLLLGDTPHLTKDFHSFFQKYHLKRSRTNIPARMMFSKQSAAFAGERAHIPLTSIKALPPSLQNPTTTDIWNDNVAFILYDAIPFIVSIKNKQFADSFREYFDALWKQDVFVTTGLPEVLNLFMKKMEGMKKGEQYSVLGGNYGKESRDITIPWFREYHKKRAARGVRAQLLSYEIAHKELFREITFGGDPQGETTELKFLQNEFQYPMQINIYPDSLTIVYWAAGDQAVAIDIQRKDIRDAMKNYFDALWQQDAQTYFGLAALQQLMEESLNYTDNWFIGGNGGITRVLPKYWEDYNRRRIEKGVIWHDLVDYNYVPLPGISYTNTGAFNKKECNELKILTAEVNSPTVIFFFGETVAHIMWDAQIAFVIKNKTLFENYRSYFDYLWVHAST